MKSIRARINALAEPRFEHGILGLMLLCLHLAIWVDFGGALSRSLMLAHLGLFLLWQPMWRREQQLNAWSGILFVAATLLFVGWLDRVSMTAWVVLLTGLLGGRITVGRNDRYAYLLSMVFMVSELLLGCIPPMVDVAPLQHEARVLFTYGLTAVPLGLLFIPGRTARSNDQSVDFLYSLTSALLACVLAMGSLLAMFLGHTDYAAAVIQTILGIAVFLLAIGWLWSPLAGFSGLGSIWERHIQTIGTPFEQWLGELEALSSADTSPDAFLNAATNRLVDLSWVAGTHWSAGGDTGEAGQRTVHSVSIRAHELELTLYGWRSLGPVLYWHATLLLKVIGHFHDAKQRELELTRNAHLQAIFETGARVTHDIKNLLQSLHTISMAVQHSEGGDPTAVQKLLGRQLPHITGRLQLALDKLQAPHDDQVTEGELGRWWDGLRMRNQSEPVTFNACIEHEQRIPIDLFDSVVENLLENARVKRQLNPNIEIKVELNANAHGLSLSVADNGPAVPEAIAKRLFRGPVESRNGLGIGLYQAARQAERLGFELRLKPASGFSARFELTRSENA